MKISRKQFLKWMGVSLAAATLPFACNPFGNNKEIKGGMVNPSAKTGHLLREGKFPIPSETITTQVLIAGAGISGLSAARWLKMSGMEDFMLLDLEKEAGGNSAAGKNEVSPYPWGAHYLPLPDLENKELLSFLRENGVIMGQKGDSIPTYNSEYLCHSPQERLLMHGIWQTSLIPQTGLNQAEKQQSDEFFGFIDKMSQAIGQDGKPAFAIPLDRSSSDPVFLLWDKISFADFLDEKGWTAKPLRWYLDYCCRDDYGASPKSVSAWAGLHYFAARTGKGKDVHESAVLTWPEGNNFLAKSLYKNSKAQFRGSSLVYHVQNSEQGVEVLFYDTLQEKSFKVECEKVIYAGPHFTAKRVIPERTVELNVHNSPWVVANLTLKFPEGRNEIATAWDNVAYGSESLGYINAKHQNLTGFPGNQTVITWYKALAQGPPKEMRQKAFEKTWPEWTEEIISDLSKMHTNIRDFIERIDVRIWGHGMAAPVPGLLWGEARQTALLPMGNVHFAHTDLSGISLFEEGFYQGIRAANEIIASYEG